MPIKFLIVIPVPSSFLPGVVRATKFLGLQTLIFNSRGYTPIEKIISLTKRETGISNKLLNQRLVRIAKEFRPDVLLVMKGELISSEAIGEIRRLGVKTINWFPDGLWAIDLIMKIVSDYDIFLHFDSLVCDVLHKRGSANVRYLPYAADILPSDKTPLKRFKKYEAVFIGNYYPEREVYFRKIADQNFYLWGDSPWETSSLRSNYQGVCKYSNVAKILSESHVSVNLHYQRAKSNGANLRVYESTSSGACLLTDYKKDLERLFNLEEEILTFQGVDDFINKVHFIENNHVLAAQIGQKGYLRIKRQNTYVHRFRDILKML